MEPSPPAVIDKGVEGKSSADKEIADMFKERAEAYMSKFNVDIVDILSHHSNEILGIFAPYKAVYDPGVTGELLLDKLARSFVDKGYSVITGKGIYYKKEDGTTEVNYFISSAIDTLAGMTNDQKKVLKFFAKIPPKAIFLLHKEKGAMDYEDDAFAEANDKELGIGFVKLIDPIKCKRLILRSIGKSFYICGGEHSSHCNENLGLCPFNIQCGINHTSNLMYVTSPHMVLAIVSDYDHIPDVSIEIFKEYCS